MPRKCQQGYYLEAGSCKLADILLMQNLDSSNLIVGNLKIEEVKQRQQEFAQKYKDFVPLKC